MAGEGFEIVVTSNARGLVDAFDDLVTKQLPFATAVALTRVAQDARDEIRKRMPQHFEIRSPRTVKGVEIERAKKTDWPNPKAQVGTRDEFMVPQILGGVKRAKKGARHVAVPTSLVTRTATGSVPKRLKPRVLRERKDVFVADQQIRRRLDKARGPLANLGEEGTYFTLVAEAKIPKRWPFVEEAQKSAMEGYGKHFERELAAAVKSARVRAGKFSSDAGKAFYLQARKAVTL